MKKPFSNPLTVRILCNCFPDIVMIYKLCLIEVVRQSQFKYPFIYTINYSKELPALHEIDFFLTVHHLLKKTHLFSLIYTKIEISDERNIQSRRV